MKLNSMKNKQSFYKCKNCGQEIAIDINSKLVNCKCGKLGVDGNGDHVWVVGEKNGSEIVTR